MKYKGYDGAVEFDEEAGIFHGEVIHLRDVITFQGTCVAELVQAFHDSVDDYLEFCKERGETPEKPYSGKIAVRMTPELHKAVASAAHRKQESINTFICEAVAKYAVKDGHA